jgi:hypothetical protein
MVGYSRSRKAPDFNRWRKSLEEGNGFVAACTNGFETFRADLTEVGQVGTPREFHKEYRNIAPRFVDGHRSARDLKVAVPEQAWDMRYVHCDRSFQT